MSQYTASRFRLRLNLVNQATTAAAQQLQRFSERCAALSGETSLLPSVEELRVAVQEMPVADIELATAPAELANLVRAYTKGLHGPSLAAADLDRLIDAYAADQVATVHLALCASLTALGFEVEEHHTTENSMIWAASADTIMAAEIGRDGRIELDTAGCSEDACIPLQNELVRELTARGVVIDFERARTTRHGRHSGGELIARWQAASDLLATPPTQRTARRTRGRAQ